MEIKRVSYVNPLERYYFQSFFDNVLVKMFDPNLVPDFETLFETVTNPERAAVWSCVVAVEDAKVVAGVTMEYLNKSKCGIVEFANADDTHLVALGEVLDHAVSLLKQDNPEMKYVFAELIEPANVVFTSRCRKLDFSYIAPAIRADSVEADGLALSVVDKKIDSVPVEVIKDMLREYFVNCYADPGIAEEYVPEFVADFVAAIDF